MARLASGPEGLTSSSARRRLTDIGPASVDEAARTGALRLFLRPFGNPILPIRLVAATLALALRRRGDAGIVPMIAPGRRDAEVPSGAERSRRLPPGGAGSGHADGE